MVRNEMRSEEPLSIMERRITMGDVDAARIIFFVAPLRWQEAVFTGWLQDIGKPLIHLLDQGFSVPTVSCKADFRVPLLLDDWVRLELWPNEVGHSSFSLRCDVYRTADEHLCVQMTNWHVWAKMGRGRDDRVRAEPLPRWLRCALREPDEYDRGTS